METCEALLRRLPLLSNVSELDFTSILYHNREFLHSDAPLRLIGALASHLTVIGVAFVAESAAGDAALEAILSKLDPRIVEEVVFCFPPGSPSILLAHECPRLRKLKNWPNGDKDYESSADLLEALIKRPPPSLTHLSFDWALPIDSSSGDRAAKCNDGVWFPSACRALLSRCPSLKAVCLFQSQVNDDFIFTLSDWGLRRDGRKWKLLTKEEAERRLGIPLERFRICDGEFSLFHYYDNVELYDACLGPAPTLSATIEALAAFCWRRGSKSTNPAFSTAEQLAFVKDKLVDLVDSLGSEKDGDDSVCCLDPLLPLLGAYTAALLQFEFPNTAVELNLFKRVLEQSETTTPWKFFATICDERLPGGFETGSMCPAALLCALFDDVAWCERVHLFAGLSEPFLEHPLDTKPWWTVPSEGGELVLTRMLLHPCFDACNIDPRIGKSIASHLIGPHPRNRPPRPALFTSNLAEVAILLDPSRAEEIDRLFPPSDADLARRHEKLSRPRKAPEISLLARGLQSPPPERATNLGGGFFETIYSYLSAAFHGVAALLQRK